MSSAPRLQAYTSSRLTRVPAGVPLLTSELFHQLGWDNLSESMKARIRPYMDDYVRCQLEGRPINGEQEQRRRRILYWIECMNMGMCTEQTAFDAIAD